MKPFKPTQEMITAASNVFIAMAFADTVRPIVKGYQQEILNKYQFKYAKKWLGRERIVNKGITIVTDIKDTYLMEDDDSKIYFKECNKARIEAKLHVDSEEFCPLLVAENLQRIAENCLVDVMSGTTGITKDMIFQSKNALENYKKLIKLNLELLAPYVKNTTEQYATI